MFMNHTRTIVESLCALILVFGAAYCSPPVHIGKAKHVTCTEDMRCWNCHTMGNHVCAQLQTICDHKHARLEFQTNAVGDERGVCVR